MPIRTFWWRPWRPFYILILLVKERIKKNTFALQGLQGYTRTHNIKPNHDWRFNDLVFKGLQDILKSCWKVKSYENRKLKGSTLCGISEFEENEKKCAYFVHNCLQFLQLYSFTYTTYKPSHRSHTIIPLSNHHTIIILKSHIFRIYISSKLS